MKPMVLRKTVLSLLFALLTCTAAHAYDAKLLSEIPVNGKISAVAMNSATDTAVVVSETGKSLAIIDTVSHAVTFEIQLPVTPSGVEVHKRLNMAIVASEDGQLFFYDLKSGAAGGTLDVGTAIHVVAVDEAANSALLGVDGGFVVVDLTNGKVSASIKLAGKAVRIGMGKTFAAVVSRDEGGSTLRRKPCNRQHKKDDLTCGGCG